jgi:hypothetical protein
VNPTTQASSLRQYHFPYMCDVPSRAVFCRECVECCPGIVSTYFFLTFTYNFRGPSDYRYDKAFHVPHPLNFYTYFLDVYIFIYSQPPFVLHSYLTVLLHQLISSFCPYF